TTHRFPKLRSTKRKFLTSAWRRSIPSMKTLDRRNSSIKLLIEVAEGVQRGAAEAVQRGAVEAVQYEPVEAVEAAPHGGAAVGAAAAEAAVAEGRAGYGRLWAGSPSVS